MKRLIGFFAILSLIVLPGCFDTVSETTINEDGSGTVSNSVDMGKMFTMLSALGGDEKMKDADKLNIDTTIFIKDIKDSLKKLSDAEKKLIEKGSAHMVMKLKDEKFSISFSVPFAKTSDIKAVNDALGKATGKIMQSMVEKIIPEDKKGELKDAENNGEGKDESTPTINSYYQTSYEKNKISNKVNKQMIAKLEEDESLKSVKEMGQMGMAMNLKTVINLPKAAKKAEGKGVKLSDDKKTVTIEGTLDDFFEDPAFFEYEIEY